MIISGSFRNPFVSDRRGLLNNSGIRNRQINFCDDNNCVDGINLLVQLLVYQEILVTQCLHPIK